MMRGQRVVLPAKKAKLDLLITSARYHPETGQLLLAKGFEPVGQVWSDILLFDRAALIERLQSGERVLTGEKEAMVADFDPKVQVKLTETESGNLIVTDGSQSNRDDLKVPIF
jgi:hypothetical protein